MNSAPLSGPVDASTFRNIAKAMSPAVVNIRSTSKQRAQEMTEFFGGGDDLLERFFGGAAAAATATAAAPAARAGDTGGRHRLRHQQGRPHPHQQPRRRGRHQDRGHVLRRGSRHLPRSHARRPRSAHRQRAHSVEGAEEGPDRGEVRRLGADAAGRLGDGHRQSVWPGAHRQRRRDQRDRPLVPDRAAAIRRRAADRRRHQSRQLRRPAVERPRRGDRHQHGHLHRRAPAGKHRHRLRHSHQHGARAAAAAARRQGHARRHRRQRVVGPGRCAGGIRPEGTQRRARRHGHARRPGGEGRPRAGRRHPRVQRQAGEESRRARQRSSS